MMRRTVARPTPVPSNSAAECSRWNAPNSLSAYFMSKPAPLSRTMNARSPFPSTDPNSTRGCACLAVYFQLFRSRFSRTTRSRRESPRASSPWAIANSTRRSGVVRCSSAAISRALRESKSKLQHYATELEQRVADRTHELQERNEALRRNAAELLAANTELDAFAYSVSHDLRAPLRSIDGFSQVLLEDYGAQLDEAGRDSLKRVRAASQRMGTLIDDLLKLAWVTRAELRTEVVDLSGMARDIAAELQRTTPERRVEFAIAQGLEARGDARLLRVVLENLLRNSWKYTAKRAQPRVEFGSIDGSGERAFIVRDNGAGFDMKYADKLFGAFQRLHSLSAYFM